MGLNSCLFAVAQVPGWSQSWHAQKRSLLGARYNENSWVKLTLFYKLSWWRCFRFFCPHLEKLWKRKEGHSPQRASNTTRTHTTMEAANNMAPGTGRALDNVDEEKDEGTKDKGEQGSWRKNREGRMISHVGTRQANIIGETCVWETTWGYKIRNANRDSST